MQDNTMLCTVFGVLIALCRRSAGDINGELEVDGHYLWTPQNSTRTDLYCPLECKEKESLNINRCCSCEANQCWDIIPLPTGCDVTISSLHIEYTSIMGLSTLFARVNETGSTYFRLLHMDGIMTSLPSNVCDFPNIISVNLSNNNIEAIGNVSCLGELNVLDLSNNNIKYLPNTTFSEMRNIRILNLAGNDIQELEPNTIKLAMGNIFSVDFSGNPLYEMDVTNAFTPNAFCVRDFSKSKTGEIVNELNIKINKDSDTVLGPGHVDFSEGEGKRIFNFTDLGIDYHDISRYVAGSVTYLDSSIACDCSLVPLLKGYGFPDILKFWPDLYTNFSCSAPEHMRGTILDKFLTNMTLDTLLCDIHENCPYQCRCIDQQEFNAILNTLHVTLPVYGFSAVLVEEDLRMNLSRTRSSAGNRHYWQRFHIKYLNQAGLYYSVLGHSAMEDLVLHSVKNKGTVLVNCTNADMTTLPADMPIGYWNSDKLELYFDGTNIKTIANTNYMSRIGTISFAGTSLETMDADAISYIPDDVFMDLSGATLTTIPNVIRRKNPHLIDFGNAQIICDCSNVWIGDWLRSYDATEKLNCLVNGKLLKSEEVTEESLGCEADETGQGLFITLIVCFAVSLIVASFVSIFLYCFRYELLILRRRYGICKKTANNDCMHDVFISFDAQNETGNEVSRMSIQRWIQSEIKPRLLYMRYTSFVPFMDIDGGDAVEANVTKAIANSRAYIILYTQDYYRTDETYLEFKCIWNQYKLNAHKNIIFINFDYTSFRSLNSRKIKALVRAGNPLDYSATQERMVDRILQRLHAALRRADDLGHPNWQDDTQDDTEVKRRNVGKEIGRRVFQLRYSSCSAGPSVTPSMAQSSMDAPLSFAATSKAELEFV